MAPSFEWAAGMSAAAYVTVLLAELVGDKSVYTIAALSMRFRRGPVFLGLALAFALKMLAAVLFGSTLVRMAGHWTKGAAALGFFACALLIWVSEPAEKTGSGKRDDRWLHAGMLSFGSIFFTEWCDTGQIAAAALASQSTHLVAVWLGGTAALLTKGGLAIFVGTHLSSRIPARALRFAGCVIYCAMGTAMLAEMLT